MLSYQPGRLKNEALILGDCTYIYIYNIKSPIINLWVRCFFGRSNRPRRSVKETSTSCMGWTTFYIFSPMFFLFENVSSHLFMAGDGFSRASPGREDPANPKVLTLNQFNKAITVRFQHTKSFHLSFWSHWKGEEVLSKQRSKQRRYEKVIRRFILDAFCWDINSH